ncbi:phenylacetate--CoA ligase family protein [Candidatus Bipolaricaulota bacterium]
MLPVLDKERLFRDPESRERLHGRADLHRCVQVTTGGYTGLPVTIYMSHGEMLFRRLQLLAEWRRFARLPIRLRIADVGSWIEEGDGHVYATYGPVSILRVSYALPLKHQIRLISRFSPHVVSGYPTTTGVLAEQWQAAPSQRSLRLVATRGEILHESERARIAEGFSTQVADFYNCEEIGNIATECVADPGVLHINTDMCIAEIVDDHGHPLPLGEEGKILLTSLCSCTMPFIRYYVGDRGAILDRGDEAVCECGSRRPRMTVIQGRDDDYVVMPDGERLSPRLVAVAAKRTTDAKARELNRSRLFSRFQFVQDGVDHVTVKIVREADWPADLDAIVSNKLRSLHPALHCTIQAVDNIPLEPSGKLKKVIRLIDTPGRQRIQPASGNR